MDMDKNLSNPLNLKISKFKWLLKLPLYNKQFKNFPVKILNVKNIINQNSKQIHVKVAPASPVHRARYSKNWERKG